MTNSWPPLGSDLNSYGGDWDAYIDACYAVYEQDFYVDTQPWPIKGECLRIKRKPVEADGRCNTFWHLTSTGDEEDSRIPDLERCKRISWPGHILREFEATYSGRHSTRIVWWKTRRRGDTRYVIALRDFSYVVIVAQRKGYVLLWTAYPVAQASRRAKLQREHDAYWEAPDL